MPPLFKARGFHSHDSHHPTILLDWRCRTGKAGFIASDAAWSEVFGKKTTLFSDKYFKHGATREILEGIRNSASASDFSPPSL